MAWNSKNTYVQLGSDLIIIALSPIIIIIIIIVFIVIIILSEILEQHFGDNKQGSASAAAAADSSTFSKKMLETIRRVKASNDGEIIVRILDYMGKKGNIPSESHYHLALFYLSRQGG